MKTLITALAGLLAMGGMAWAKSCKVVDPTGTLAVRAGPNGAIVDALGYGAVVSMSSVITLKRQTWAKIQLGKKTGWVYRNYLLCED